MKFAFLTLLCTATLAGARADEFPGSVKDALVEQTGKKVELRMESGQVIGGKVERVSDTAVVLSSVTGQEFFNAVVALDTISAVLVRVKQ